VAVVVAVVTTLVAVLVAQDKYIKADPLRVSMLGQ
jgi:hypothetical protein